jgi:hypothetical protein
MEAGGVKFYDWLGAYLAEETPWGDFARDTRRDPTFPKGVRSLKGVLRHLRGGGRGVPRCCPHVLGDVQGVGTGVVSVEEGVVVTFRPQFNHELIDTVDYRSGKHDVVGLFTNPDGLPVGASVWKGKMHIRRRGETLAMSFHGPDHRWAPAMPGGTHLRMYSLSTGRLVATYDPHITLGEGETLEVLFPK